MELIRKYCFGDNEIKVKIVSDQANNFAARRVNYEDPNFNVQHPIFSIHGNHDDPSGVRFDGQFPRPVSLNSLVSQDGSLAALDILSTCAFVNYFGRSTDLHDIEVNPILMEKGATKLAIYGLGNVRDERLNRIFASKKVKFLRPEVDAENWFNVFVCHQNRVAHSPKNYIDPKMLPEWINLIIWGHEHECNISPTPAAVGGFRISQPGSSIATALSEFEAKPKHVGLLQIAGTQFRLKAIPLRTVRPFVIDEIVLSSVPELESLPKKAYALFAIISVEVLTFLTIGR